MEEHTGGPGCSGYKQQKPILGPRRKDFVRKYLDSVETRALKQAETPGACQGREGGSRTT